MSPLELMLIQVATLFDLDDDERMVCTNEPLRRRLAPYLFVGLTCEGTVLRFASGLPDKLCQQLSSIVAQHAGAPSNRSRELSDALKAHLSASGRAVETVWAGPAYSFPRGPKPEDDCLFIENRNKAVLAEHFPHLLAGLEYAGPCIALVENGSAVAACRTVRRSTRAAEAGVETAEAYRGRGFGTRVVLKWADEVRRGGQIPLYSTSYTNVASQRVAAKLRLVQFGVDVHLSGHESRSSRSNTGSRQPRR